MIYLKLFWDFFQVSCFTFGGAYGAIPLIRDMVMGNGWITEERFAYMIAVSESTPGPIMVNMATYVGSDQAGFWGSLAATVGVVLPAYLVILLIVSIMKNAIKNRYVQAVLRGLKPCVWVKGRPARLKARWNSRIRSRWEIQTAFPVFSNSNLGIALHLLKQAVPSIGEPNN